MIQLVSAAIGTGVALLLLAILIALLRERPSIIGEITHVSGTDQS